MSDTKHNLLHLLKIITAPLTLVAAAMMLIELVFLGIMEWAGFRMFDYESPMCFVLDKWENLP